MEDENWKCAGCGAPSPGRLRSCACATSVVFNNSVQAWKIEPYEASLRENQPSASPAQSLKAENARLRGLLERAAHLCGQLGDRSYVATVDIPVARALKAEIEEALK